MKTRKIAYSDLRTSGSSMADLPEDIFYDIMLRLSIRSIVMSKSVCKTWRDLISDPRFAKQHLAQAKPSLLIRDIQQSRFARALYMVESVCEDDFGSGYCSCYSSKRECNHCRGTMKVKSKLKIPIRNKNLLLRQVEGDIANVIFGTNRRCKRKNYEMVVPESLWKYAFSYVSSCNGLLCLFSDYDNRVIVYNPITGEYICLSDPSYKNTIFCNVFIGFSPKSNQYKVLRVPISHGDAVKIHTLGTTTSRAIDLSEFQPRCYGPCVCMNGALHWLCFRNAKSPSQRIACFDLEEECFRPPFPIPNSLRESSNVMPVRLLGDRLCLYHHDFAFSPESCVDVWAMEEYGVGESWTRLVSINVSMRSRKLEIKAISRFQTASSWINGSIILMDEYNTLIYCDQRGEFRFKHIRSRGIKSEFEAILHTPSFASLKDMVDTTTYKEVCNVYSGCGKIQFMEENYPVYLACKKKD